MTITASPLMGRTASAKQGERTYTHKYQIDTTANETDAQILSYFWANVVSAYSPHPQDSFVKARSFSLQEDEESRWTLSVEYGPSDRTSENPCDEPAKRSWTYTPINRPIDRTVDDERIENSCGDPPVKPIEIPVFQATLTITKNVGDAEFDQQEFWQLGGTINSDQFLQAEEGMVQFMPQSATEQDDVGFGRWWVIQYSFVFHVQKLSPYPLLDQGYRVKNDAGDVVPAEDGEGNPSSEPILLNGSGKKLPSGEPPVIIDLDILPSLPFNRFQVL